MKQFILLLAMVMTLATSSLAYSNKKSDATTMNTLPKTALDSSLDSNAEPLGIVEHDSKDISTQAVNDTNIESPEPEPEETPDKADDVIATGDSSTANEETDLTEPNEKEGRSRQSTKLENSDDNDNESDITDVVKDDDEQEESENQDVDAAHQNVDDSDVNKEEESDDDLIEIEDSLSAIKDANLDSLFKNAVVIPDDDNSGADSLLNNTGRTSLDSTDRKRRKLRSFWVWVVIAAKHKSWVFKNAKHLGDTKGWNQVRTYKFRATRNDVVAIKSIGRGAFRGVAAVIRVDWPGRGRRVHRRYYVTGRSNNYKAIPTSRASRRDRRFWMRPTYKTCHWPAASIVPTGRHWARRFPFRRFRARYVWARGERRGKQILMRYKLAGERCQRPRFPKRCACRPVRSQPAAACYRFTNKRMYKTINRRARCVRRRCAAKFECVFGRRRPRTVCVRRFATTEVRVVGRVFRRVCYNARIRRKPFYVPYQ